MSSNKRFQPEQAIMDSRYDGGQNYPEKKRDLKYRQKNQGNMSEEDEQMSAISDMEMLEQCVNDARID